MDGSKELERLQEQLRATERRQAGECSGKIKKSLLGTRRTTLNEMYGEEIGFLQCIHL
jgi:hypothetical protein